MGADRWLFVKLDIREINLSWTGIDRGTLFLGWSVDPRSLCSLLILLLKPMIDVKTAVSSAHQYLQSVQEMFGGSLDDLRLEEVELSEDKHAWLITLGYDLPVKSRSHLEELLTPSALTSKKIFVREYKMFRVNAETGEVESMKIRRV